MGYGIGFDTFGTFFSLGDKTFGRKVIIFNVDMSSSAHIDDKEKVIVILGESLTRGFDDTPYPIFYLQKISLSVLYHGTSRYFFLNGVEIIKFKSKDSENKAFLLCLRNVSKDFSFDDNKDTEFMVMFIILVLIMILLLLVIY